MMCRRRKELSKAPGLYGKCDLKRGNVCARHLVEREEVTGREMQSELIWSGEERKGNGGAMGVEGGGRTA